MDQDAAPHRQVAEVLAQSARAYRAGEFAAAASGYHRVLEADPANPEALAGAGSVALLGNRLGEARTWLERLLAGSAGDPRALTQLAEAAYRQDDFAAAARWWNQFAAGAAAPQRGLIEGVASKLAAFRGMAPYQAVSREPQTRVPFLITDPVPMVSGKPGGGPAVPFLLDTGGHEVMIDQAIARDLRLPEYGSAAATGAGGRTATITHSLLPTLELGGLRIHNLPAHIMDLTVLGEVEGLPVRGVIGTAFLYHHLATVDYPGGALILRPRTPAQSRSFAQRAVREGQHVIPFWLAGTHLILARGSVNGSGPLLLLVDTGLKGAAFTGPPRTLSKAGGITLQHENAYLDHGAGGATRVIPFTVAELTLGPVTARHLTGLHIPGTDPGTDLGQPFPVDGVISHQFFRPYRLTFDFTAMRLYLG